MNELMTQKEFELAYSESFHTMSMLNTAMEELKARQEKVKDELQAAMEKHGIVGIDNEYVQISHVAPTVSTTIDTKKMRAEDPELYHKCMDAYSKSSVRKGYIRIKYKEIKND